MKMRLLELCSGSGSLSRVARSRGWETLTLDNDPRTRPDLVADIREFDPAEHGDFDWVHASPPCQFYSIACTGCPRDFERGDLLSSAALRILEHYSERGACCTMENPATGFLKVRPHMLAHRNRMKTLDLCKYGAPWRKRSAYWCWNFEWEPRPLCRKDCPVSDGHRHLASAQKGADRRKGCPRGRDQNEWKTHQLQTIPDELAEEVCAAIEAARA